MNRGYGLCTRCNLFDISSNDKGNRKFIHTQNGGFLAFMVRTFGSARG